MAKKKGTKKPTIAQDVQKQENLLENLPRTITPIGIFFGHGAKREEAGQGLPFRRRQRKPRSAIGTPVQRNVIALVAAVLFALVGFFVNMPALNVRDSHFWVLLLIATIAFIVLRTFLDGTPERKKDNSDGFLRSLYRSFGSSIVLAGALALVLVVGNLSSWVFLRPGAYARLVDVPEASFAQQIAPAEASTLPALDTAAATILAQEALDKRADLTSDFSLSKNGAQIVYQGELVHVFPLAYSSWQANMQRFRDGIPAFVLVVDATREATVIDVDGTLKYGGNNYAFGDINHHLRFTYPYEIFRDTHFELDDGGHPYWVCATICKTVGAFGGDEVNGAIVIDAVSGESKHYELDEVPEWVDALYSTGFLITQYNNYGIYHNGFLNALSDKVDVTSIAKGYGCFGQGKDLYLCAGVSEVSDVRTTIGYLLVNQRTKNSFLVRTEGNDEVAAQTVAVKQVGQDSSIASYPVLVNVNGIPTYCMCIMDEDYNFRDVALVSVDEASVIVADSNVWDCLQQFMQDASQLDYASIEL